MCSKHVTLDDSPIKSPSTCSGSPLACHVRRMSSSVIYAPNSGSSYIQSSPLSGQAPSVDVLYSSNSSTTQTPTAEQSSWFSSSSPNILSCPQHTMHTRAKSGIFCPHYFLNLNHTLAIDVLTWASKAVFVPQRKSVMIDEYNVLLTNRTWDVVPFHSSINLVGCK